DADAAQDARPGPVAAQTARARVAAQEDVHATDVPHVEQCGRVPDRVERVDREPGERPAVAIHRVDAVVVAPEHDVGRVIAVDVADRRRADHAALPRDGHRLDPPLHGAVGVERDHTALLAGYVDAAGADDDPFVAV